MTHMLDQQLVDWADDYLDNDERQAEYAQLGESLFDVFGSDKGKVSSQVRNLQSIVNSARRFHDIELFLKNQMGREKSNECKWGKLKPRPLAQLQKIADQTDAKSQFCAVPPELIPLLADQKLALRLTLARGWVRSVVGAYMFAKAQREQPAGDQA